MNPWFARILILSCSIALVVIRAPHGQRSRHVKVVRSRKGTLETCLLTLALLGFFVPLFWIATPLLAFADYPSRPLPFALGALCLASGLWVFHRSHRDLGTNWSITLELREDHRLVTEGIYRHVRHPMYLGLLLYSLGQAIALPNWVAGPSYGIPFVILLALRIGREEQMMLEAFGGDYETYSARTSRLVPGVW